MIFLENYIQIQINLSIYAKLACKIVAINIIQSNQRVN
jgi:hypothetical protein